MEAVLEKESRISVRAAIAKPLSAAIFCTAGSSQTTVTRLPRRAA